MTLCPLCGEQMMVMPSPEEEEVTYDHQSKRVYHQRCLEEYREFQAYYDYYNPMAWLDSVKGRLNMWRDAYEELKDYLLTEG